MKIDTNLALIPVPHENIQPVKKISNSGVTNYDNEKKNFARMSLYSGSKFSRMSNTYGRMGNENNKNGPPGENIDLYV